MIIRFFSAYGPGLRKQLLWELGSRLLRAPVEVELGGTGEEARDFLFVDDAVELVRHCAGLGRHAEPLVLNGATGLAVTVREAAGALALALDAQTAIGFSGAGRPGDPARLVADVRRAATSGFRARIPFEDGVARYAGWLKAQA